MSASSPPAVPTQHEEGRLDGDIYWQSWRPEGEAKAVDAFAAWLEQGPRHARVADVDVQPIDPFDADSFEITR